MAVALLPARATKTVYFVRHGEVRSRRGRQRLGPHRRKGMLRGRLYVPGRVLHRCSARGSASGARR